MTDEIAEAVAVLRAGGLVALPTETVYGLAADATNIAAVRRIFEAKQRPASHPLIVHISGADQLADWVTEVPPTARRLAERFWPGPLTLILPRGERVPAETAGGLATVAIRAPDHPLAQALLTAFGGGIAAPSANRFGSISPTTADDVRTELGDAIDFVLDGGPCQVGVESTIVQIVDHTPSILRPGGVSREQLEAILGEPVAVPATSPTPVPGQHPTHYAPRAKVVLVKAGQLISAAVRAHQQGHRVGVLIPPDVSDTALTTAHAQITVPESMQTYAHELYRFLREFDHQGCDLIIASLPQSRGLGLAIANRLTRAAGPRNDHGPATDL
ncbi:L-threonylcarbamoyladenylate synthase [Microlunatus soli]|nr:L-threonylcarbamoyladenylate synthase [Microlunatus soli]